MGEDGTIDTERRCSGCYVVVWPKIAIVRWVGGKCGYEWMRRGLKLKYGRDGR